MADNTKIEWADATWNPITGCSIVSPGCTNCYAMQLAATRLKHTPSREGLTKCVNGNHVWTGDVRLNENTLDQPLKWKRPRKIFVCAHGDLFHENVPFEWIDKVFAIMALCPHHTFIVLTKRAARMQEYMNKLMNLKGHYEDTDERMFGGIIWEYGEEFPEIPFNHVWLGVSVENQETANERIPVLLDTPAAMRFISAEPLLGAVDLTNICFEKGVGFEHWGSAIFDCDDDQDPNDPLTYLDWVIVGGESGKNARPLHPEWVRKIRDDCTAANVPFFFKQWGEWCPIGKGETWKTPHNGWLPANNEQYNGRNDYIYEEEHGAALIAKLGKKVAGNSLDGVQHLEFPRGI